MCDIWRANKNQESLSVADLQPQRAALKSLGVRWVTLSGREALLHPPLPSLCELLTEMEVKITRLSTGLLLRKHAPAVCRRFQARIGWRQQ